VTMKTNQGAQKLIEFFASGSVLEKDSAHFLFNAIATEGRDPSLKKENRIFVPDEQHVVYREVTRCMTNMLSNIMSRYNIERCKEKKTLCKRQLKEAESLQQSNTGNKKSRCDSICYEFIATGGRCSKGDSCRNTHRDGSILELPVKYRCFETCNQFPLSREISQCKQDVNIMISRLSSNLANKRCLVLDGSSSNTARALRGCEVQSRRQCDIIIPNYCFATFEKIRELGGYFILQLFQLNYSLSLFFCLAFGTAFYGSLRAYLDLSYYDTWKSGDQKVDESSQFGLIYLDYCSRISAGYSSVEKCPIADIEAIFKYRSLSYIDGLLVICFCRSEEDSVIERQSSSHDDDTLNNVLFKCAEHAGYHLKHFADHNVEYGVVLVRVFAFTARDAIS